MNCDYYNKINRAKLPIKEAARARNFLFAFCNTAKVKESSKPQQLILL